MGAASEETSGADQATGHIRGQVVLTQMNAIGIHCQGQINPVVDDQQSAVITAESSQGSGFRQSFQVASGFTAVLNHGHTAAQSSCHAIDQVRAWAGDQAELAVLQPVPTVVAAGRCEAGHLQVVNAIADGGGLSGQRGIHAAPVFLQHSQSFLHPAAVGLHDLPGAVTVELRRMLHARTRVGDGGAGSLVALLMQLAESLTPILQADHQVIPLQSETAPVLNDPQPFAGSIEIGIDQPCHTGIQGRLATHQIRGTLWRIALP